MVKLALPASLVLAAAVTALTASAIAAPSQSKKSVPAKDLYDSNCQMCHGVDGRAPLKEMAFVGRQWKTKTTAQAVKVITNGVPGTVMLPFEGKLTREQITALARYVRALDTPTARKKK
jgi:mono/diheme cytochrome c family protein